jgi:hypothetical protein
MYTKEQLLDPQNFTKADLVNLILHMQNADRRIFAATLLGSMIQNDDMTGDVRELIKSAIDIADRLIDELDP